MATSYSFAKAQHLIIKPFERIGFITLFVLMSILSKFIAAFIYSQPTFELLWEQSQMQYGIASGIISGTFIGAAQWLIIRKYISDWKWILVTGLVTTCMTVFGIVQQSFLSPTNSLLRQEIFRWEIVIFSISMPILILIISGYMQWYILRPYIAQTRWWIFIYLIAVPVFLALPILEYSTNGFLRFNRDIVNLTALPMTQAIGFCMLDKKSINEHPILQSPLALAPDVVNFRDVQRLAKILDAKISRTWKIDLEMSIKQLNYLVGINENNSDIIYEPIDQFSLEQVDQTPLPELTNNLRVTALEKEDLTSVAKFKVIFSPLSEFQIHSWRGIPLLWIGVALYIGVVVISIFCAKLQIDILPFRK